MVRNIQITFTDVDHLDREFTTNLKNGGIFAPGATGFVDLEACVVQLIHPVSLAILSLPSSVVWADPAGSGTGVAFSGFDPDMRDQIAAFIASNRNATGPQEPSAQSEPSVPSGTLHDSDAPAAKADAAQTVHERLRNLSVNDQKKLARTGNANERIALERIYGKAVWEPLLQNTRLTIPEVARIARMGSLPRPLVEIIVNSPSWLSGAPVRRALLSNPRLSRDLIPKVLKTMPRAELKMVPKQMSYTSMVRDAARKILKQG